MSAAVTVDVTVAPVVEQAVRPFVDAGVFSAAEAHAAATLARLSGENDPLVHLAIALAYWAPLHGHVCVDLAMVDDVVPIDQAIDSVRWPELEPWLAALRASPLVRCVDAHDARAVLDEHPLVLHGTRLTLQRQWIDECLVAASIRARCGGDASLSPSAAALLDELLDDAQRRAAVLSLTSRLAVVVGGPGTGKTHTLVRALAVAIADAKAMERPLRIALCAPTGKAAQRMREAVAGALAAGDVPADIADELAALQPTTIHRLLGSRPGHRTRFAHDAESPLPHDLVVVDEASMVALPLMARLLEAVRPGGRLVMVGDPGQLESVEAGAVLADIVRAAEAPVSGGAPALAAHVVRLQRPRRFDGASALGRIADAIGAGDADTVIELLRSATSDPSSRVVWSEAPDPLAAASGAGVAGLVVPAVRAAADAAAAGDAITALTELGAVRVLCAHRHGRFGASAWNAAIESWAGLHGPWHPGRALLVTRNDPRTGLVNGDTGVVVVDDGRRAVAFRDPSDTRGRGVRVFAPAQLDHVETAFATTIHKSQGSEYRRVAVVLPPESRLLSRELLYTAITRSRGDLLLAASEDSVRACVLTASRRMTGLPGALVGA